MVELIGKFGNIRILIIWLDFFLQLENSGSFESSKIFDTSEHLERQSSESLEIL